MWGPFLALSLAIFMISSCWWVQRGPADDNFERSASTSVHLSFAMPRRASSSRSDISKVKRCLSTCHKRRLESELAFFEPAIRSRDFRRGVIVEWPSRTRKL